MSESTKRIYFVRHGQTDANVHNRLTDHTEPLNDVGRMQAAQLAERVGGLDIDALIVSDYRRAQETMEPVARALKLEPVIDSDFGEIRERTDFVGTSADIDLVRESWSTRDTLAAENPHHKDGDEESLHEFRTRVDAAREVLESHEADSILVVSHGFFLSCFIAHILFGDSTPSTQLMRVAGTFKLSNTGISYLTYKPEESKWRVVMVNDHAHFAE